MIRLAVAAFALASFPVAADAGETYVPILVRDCGVTVATTDIHVQPGPASPAFLFEGNTGAWTDCP